jgi:hypothetical protein
MMGEDGVNLFAFQMLMKKRTTRGGGLLPVGRRGQEGDSRQGARKLRCMAVTLGVNRKNAQRLMRPMRIEAHYPKPRLSQPAPGHTVYGAGTRMRWGRKRRPEAASKPYSCRQKFLDAILLYGIRDPRIDLKFCTSPSRPFSREYLLH